MALLAKIKDDFLHEDFTLEDIQEAFGDPSTTPLNVQHDEEIDGDTFTHEAKYGEEHLAYLAQYQLLTYEPSDGTYQLSETARDADGVLNAYPEDMDEASDWIDESEEDPY
jgi:hypothetical protein